MNGMTKGRTIPGAPRRRRRAGTLAAIVVAGAAVAGLTACEPAGDGRLRSGSVAHTTDRTATKTLERLGVEVNWFVCRADTAGDERASAPPAYATVDCEGKTDSGRRITLTGRVTQERSGLCVRGDLTARIAGRTAFDATYLGDCTAKPTTRPPRYTPGTLGTDRS
ncbi:hypothetical protein ABT354_04560 [Streptomyces sp. NPDC000594]|uniref:hypothetical protein n=1 Tax=Streptomyces sp. NPDC000594 TaxID=3154261 RepID=UPI00331C8DC3